MKKILFVTVSAAAALFCGCQHTRVDQVQPSEGMQDWYKDIRDNYPGFQPPALVSPGVSGYTAPKAEKNEGGSAHRRPRHRGGRRHNKNKSSSANSGGEA